MASSRAIASELASEYGRAYVINPQGVKYNPATKEIVIDFKGKSCGVMTKAEEVARSFEDFVENLFCSCISQGRVMKRNEQSIELSSAFESMPIAVISQYGTRVYITPKTDMMGAVPIKSVLTGFKKSLLRQGHA